jgi:hypothetical protein
MASETESHEAACLVAHNLISKLAAIVGRCGLLNERTKQSAEFQMGSFLWNSPVLFSLSSARSAGGG